MSHPRFPSWIDMDNPPPGSRLQIGSIAAELAITMKDMARAAGISTTAMFDVVASNKWPVRTPVADIKASLERLFQERGATLEHMATLWQPVIRANWKTPGQAARLMAAQPKREPQPPAAPQPAPEPQETEMLLPKQTLTLEARKAFKLFTNPFDGDVQSDEQMFVNNEIAYVREACWQAAVGGRLVAVTSESGGGKTTIVLDLEDRIERDRKQVIVIRPSVLGMEDNDTRGHALKSTDILAAIITTLDPLARVPLTLEARSKLVGKLLRTSIEAGFQHLLVIEEAHCLPDATLRHCKRLHELHLGRKAMLGILLVAQPELATKLSPSRASLREVTQRCEVVQLLPLDNDLQAYLAHRAQVAGLQLEQLIDAAGIEEVRARLTVTRPGSGGKTRAHSLLYPLAVNNLMTAALNVAAELGVPVVTRDVVRAV